MTLRPCFNIRRLEGSSSVRNTYIFRIRSHPPRLHENQTTYKIYISSLILLLL